MVDVVSIRWPGDDLLEAPNADGCAQRRGIVRAERRRGSPDRGGLDRSALHPKAETEGRVSDFANASSVSATQFEARTVGDRIHGRCECGMVPGMQHYRSGCEFAREGGKARSVAVSRKKGSVGGNLRTDDWVGADAEPPSFQEGR